MPERMFEKSVDGEKAVLLYLFQHRRHEDTAEFMAGFLPLFIAYRESVQIRAFQYGQDLGKPEAP